jgi:cytochrome c1
MGVARPLAVIAVLAGLLVSLISASDGQTPGGQQTAPPSGVHESHGTPKGWRFKWPKGDPVKGRVAFAKFECYACHEVSGETFPGPKDTDNVGPELSVMGPLHEAEYFAESIINPSAVIDEGKRYEGADGSSKMPSFNDSMTVQEAIDLVAYLRSLKPAAGAPASHHGH